MAQKTIVRLIDDFDGGQADQTVRFGLHGVSYVIDLSDARAKELEGALAPFVEKARKDVPKRRARGLSSRERSAEIRRWAKNNNIEVNERGRIPESVVEQYEAAH